MFACVRNLTTDADCSRSAPVESCATACFHSCAVIEMKSNIEIAFASVTCLRTIAMPASPIPPPAPFESRRARKSKMPTCSAGARSSPQLRRRYSAPIAAVNPRAANGAGMSSVQTAIPCPSGEKNANASLGASTANCERIISDNSSWLAKRRACCSPLLRGRNCPRPASIVNHNRSMPSAVDTFVFAGKSLRILCEVATNIVLDVRSHQLSRATWASKLVEMTAIATKMLKYFCGTTAASIAHDSAKCRILSKKEGTL